jgi:hypothetical protein
VAALLLLGASAAAAAAADPAVDVCPANSLHKVCVMYWPWSVHAAATAATAGPQHFFSTASRTAVAATRRCRRRNCMQSLPFLKAAKPGALSTLLGPDGLSINMAAITDFIKTTLVPMM